MPVPRDTPGTTGETKANNVTGLKEFLFLAESKRQTRITGGGGVKNWQFQQIRQCWPCMGF